MLMPAGSSKMAQRIATALNRFTERAFLDVLSSRDQQSMSEFITDYFCDGPETDSEAEEEEPGK